jgi:hypothetical protein
MSQDTHTPAWDRIGEARVLAFSLVRRRVHPVKRYVGGGRRILHHRCSLPPPILHHSTPEP